MPQDMLLEGSKVQKQYQTGLQYHRQAGHFGEWPEFERFKAGDQWPQATPKTRNLPRPVFNIIKYIINHKVATVANENLKMVFSAEEIPDDVEQMPINAMSDTGLIEKAIQAADKFTKLADTTYEDIQQDELNREMLDSAGTIGTGILHYYWDDNIKGGIIKPYIGKMRGEVLDPINVFFGNPQEKDVEKQPYIIISSREEVKTVKEIAKANKVKQEYVDQIKPDKNTEEEGYDKAKTELDDAEKTTVLTKYWRENGTIYFTKVCGNIVIKPKTDLGINLYPIAVMRWEERKKSIHGIGEPQGLIPNQKGINFLLAMMLLSAQQTAWPKIIAKAGSLKQTIKNVPGEIITDYLPSQNDNIKYMQTGSFNTNAFGLVDKFVELTKTFAGATETATGSLDKAGQFNAQAIMLLQQAAGVPIEQIRKRFYATMEKVGRIWAEFWKAKYNTTRLIKVRDENENQTSMEFNGEEYQDVPLSLRLDIGPSTSYSESLMMSSLDKFLDSGAIDFMDYLDFAPKNVIPYKDRLKRRLEEKQADQMQNDTLSIIAGLDPQEREAFFSLPPEEQQQFLMQAMGEEQPTQMSGATQPIMPEQGGVPSVLPSM